MTYTQAHLFQRNFVTPSEIEYGSSLHSVIINVNWTLVLR